MKKRINYKMLSPLSHIGETASTGSYFQTVLTANGRVPVITGNSIRGQLRDSMALHLLELLDTKISKDTFNILFSGGNINTAMKDDVEKAKNIRAHFPLVSLMGGGLGDMIMAGKLISTFAYPVCKETFEITGIDSPLSWHSLIDEMEFTRMDDAKDDRTAVYLLDATEDKTAKASTQMRFSVQYMAAGTEFVQDFRFLDGVTDLELGAFYTGLRKWFEVPKLGGMAAKGFGLFDAHMDDDSIGVENGEIYVSTETQKLIYDYENFICMQGVEALSLFDTKKEKKMAKKSTKPIKVTAHLSDGLINSADGVIMLDSILYHAWFCKHCPEVLQGLGNAEYDGYTGLPLRQLPGNRWAASRGVYEEIGQTVEHINKRPNFFNADKINHLDMEKGIISDSVGQYRAYRIPNVIRTVKGGTIAFWAMGHVDEVQALLNCIPAVGKKYAAGYGIVADWTVEECSEDYSLWHPEYGLMRPVEIDSEEAKSFDLTGYPVMQYGVKPPYWKSKNFRLCYVPIKGGFT